tara:strand:- start:3167 stop:3967 length:801 start_codon:yes stop_codon:yes gene_type:complete
MKSLIALSLLCVSSAAFACNTGAVMITRETGFGFNSNGNHNGGVTHTVNIPVTVAGKRGCWEQKGALSFDVKDDENQVSILIPKAKFKKIPDARLMSYVMVSKIGDGLDLEVATIACAGQSVLSIEAFEGNVQQARVLQEISVSASTVFATGAAAANIARRQEALRQMYGQRSIIPTKLSQYFEDNFTGVFEQLESSLVRLPSVYLGFSMETPLASLNASYSTIITAKSACSREFEQIMAPFRIESTHIPEGVKAKIKKGNLRLTW